MAAAFTGLGITSLPRPRRLSTRVTTAATSKPACTSASSGGTAIAGVPRYTSRRGTSRAARPARRRGVTSGADDASVLACAAGVSRMRRYSASASLRCSGLHPVEHQHAVQVVELVLEQPPGELARLRSRSCCRRGRDHASAPRSGRSISTYRPGMLRQPSSYTHSPRLSTISGLMMTIGCVVDVPHEDLLLHADLRRGQADARIARRTGCRTCRRRAGRSCRRSR